MKTGKTANLETFRRKIAEEAKGYPEAAVYHDKLIRQNGMAGFEILHRWKDDPRQIYYFQNLTRYVRVGQSIYRLSYDSSDVEYERFLSLVVGILDSIKFKNIKLSNLLVDSKNAFSYMGVYVFDRKAFEEAARGKDDKEMPEFSKKMIEIMAQEFSAFTMEVRENTAILHRESDHIKGKLTGISKSAKEIKFLMTPFDEKLKKKPMVVTFTKGRLSMEPEGKPESAMQFIKKTDQ